MNAVVPLVGDVKPTVGAERTTRRQVEIARGRAALPPFAYKRALVRKVLDAVVIFVRYEDPAVAGAREAARAYELAVPLALSTPFPEKYAVGRKILYPVIIFIRNVNLARGRD